MSLVLPEDGIFGPWTSTSAQEPCILHIGAPPRAVTSPRLASTSALFTLGLRLWRWLVVACVCPQGWISHANRYQGGDRGRLGLKSCS